MAPKQAPAVRVLLTNKERMAVYAVLVKYEETCEEATAWLLRGEAHTKAYSELCATMRPHLHQPIRDHHTGEKFMSLVDGNHKEEAKVCRAENGEYDAVDAEQAAHWRNVDALTRSLRADVRTASDSTPDKMRTITHASKKKRKSEQGKKQDKYNKLKKTAKRKAQRAHIETLRRQFWSDQQLYQDQQTAAASAMHGRMRTGLFAKSIGTPQVEVDAVMASMPEVHNAFPPPTPPAFVQISEESSDETTSSSNGSGAGGEGRGEREGAGEGAGAGAAAEGTHGRAGGGAGAPSSIGMGSGSDADELV